MIWILIGLALIALEAIVPTAFVALVSGVAALIVAIVGSLITVNFQILLWLGLSVSGILASRQFVSKRSAPRQFDARSARTLTAVNPTSGGRVQYEGNSWAARCEDPSLTIPPDQPVWVVSQAGTTLLVIPQTMPMPQAVNHPEH
jgi:membrane protein implicated in regulation of membrane protease activity